MDIKALVVHEKNRPYLLEDVELNKPNVDQALDDLHDRKVIKAVRRVSER